jgi:hypothetical protein
VTVCDVTRTVDVVCNINTCLRQQTVHDFPLLLPFFYCGCFCVGARALPQAVSCRLRFQVMWDFWWTKCHWDGFSPGTSISLDVAVGIATSYGLEDRGVGVLVLVG